MHDTVIVRYGEIFLKSGYVRKRFEDMLIENMRRRLDAAGLEARVCRTHLRLYLKTEDAERVCGAVSTVYGVTSVSCAKETGSDAAVVTAAAMDYAMKVLPGGESFAVRVKRSGTHPYSSMELARIVGGAIHDGFGNPVDLEKPDKTINIEVRDGSAYIFHSRLEGPGGLPYGSQERLVSLISGGIDSPVASYLMMRRGCRMSFVHMGGAGEVERIVGRLSSMVDRKLILYTIPYDDALAGISKKAGRHTCIVCKRFMYRAAERIAELEGAYGIVTGDNIGQVASQTLENLRVIDCVDLPVYRPAIGMDKEQIIKVAREIGTYDLMVKTPCPYVPQKPATRCVLEEIEKIEQSLDIQDLLDSVVSRVEKREI